MKDHLTEPNPELAARIKSTPLGMMSWAGGGACGRNLLLVRPFRPRGEPEKARSFATVSEVRPMVSGHSRDREGAAAGYRAGDAGLLAIRTANTKAA